MRALLIAALISVGSVAEAQSLSPGDLEIGVPKLVLARNLDASRWFVLLEEAQPFAAQARVAPPMRNEGSLFLGAAIAIQPGAAELPLLPSLRLGVRRMAYDLPLSVETERIFGTIGLGSR